MTSVGKNSKYGTVRRYFLVATVCTLLIPLYSYGDIKKWEQSDVNDTPIQKKQLKTIIVDNYSPYTFVNQNGDPDGFSVDLIRAVAQEMGLELEIDVDTWDLARNALKSGDIDVLPMMAYSKERDRQFDFSVPHTIAYDAFFMRKDESKIRSLDDLRGKKIIVMKGDQANDYLLSTELIGAEQLILIESLPDALRLLSSGKGDATLMPKLVGLIIAKNLKLNNLELSPIVIEAYNRPFSFAVTEGNLPLLERLNQGLIIVKKSDQYSNIYEKWFGALEPPGLSLRTVLKYIGGIILVFIVIGSVLVLWSFSLRRQVALRTRTLNEEITERVRSEEALRESEEEYRQLSDSLPQIVFETDEKGNLTFTNRVAFDILGYTREDFEKGLNALQMLIPEDQDRALKNIQRVLKGEKLGGTEYTALTKDGRRYPAMVYSTPIISEGKSVGMRGIVADLTEVKRAEEALRESEERYRSLVENQTDLVSRFTPDGTFVFVNNAYCHFSEKTKDELIGKKWHPLPVGDDLSLVQEKLQTLSPSNPTVLIENRILSGKGHIHWVQFINSGFFDLDGNLMEIQSVGRDITDRVQAEEEKGRLEDQLQKARKMESMGLMAGGIAHDLNNILSGIVSYPELLLMDLPEDSPLRKPIKTIQESGMRAADVVEDLLTIARGVVSGKEVLNLNTVIEEYLVSAEHQKLERIDPLNTFKTELDSELLNITCSPSHVKKVLMNLIVNASEAIEGRGTVTISTMNRYLDEPLRGYEDVRTGEYVVLAISDDGSGISPQDLDRIFEPFYTKKVMGRSGTGLGLAVVWNSMQDHDGYINVKSSEKGTVFELYFPTTREQVADEREQVPLEDYIGDGEKILVVDDEERQREIASGILTRLAYNVETVSSGEEAILYVKENPVDLIVLDMVMPKGINGRKTYEEIIKIHPGQKAIIASGYAKTKEVGIAQSLGAGRYIKKPYTLEKVGLAVKEELEK